MKISWPPRAAPPAPASRGRSICSLLTRWPARRGGNRELPSTWAYRYFATPRRKFIIADAPGHEQYTRKHGDGPHPSAADLAIVLVDARRGVLPQSRRHAYIASLLGIRRTICGHQQDGSSGVSEEVFPPEFAREFSEYFVRLGVPEGVEYIPLRRARWR